MLELTDLKKSFGNTQALTGLSLIAKPGEILGIAGPNGAGKSTLIGVLSGEMTEDEGQVVVDARLLSAGERSAQVSVVHQELRLFPTLTVMENLLVGIKQSSIFRPKPTKVAIHIAEEFGLMEYADHDLDSCSLVIQQLTEIARAILQDRKVILLDEPNSALTTAESEQLFKEVTRLKNEGDRIIIIVSHRLADLEKYCDRVCVLRDGKVVAELSQPLRSSEIAQAIVGGGSNSLQSAVSMANWREQNPIEAQTAALLELIDWSDAEGSSFANINLEVQPGQIVVITGQEDGGGREILRSVSALRRATGELRSPLNIAKESCYIPGSRKSSLFFNYSIEANLATRLTKRLLGGSFGGIRFNHLEKNADEMITKFEIRTENRKSAVGSLSGGTQQKVALGSAFAATPRLLVLEDPTRGVDIKTRAEIVSFLRNFVLANNSVLVFSPEIDEVYELADVVVVAVKGQLSQTLDALESMSLVNLAAWIDDHNRLVTSK